MSKRKYDVLGRNGTERFIVMPEREYEAMCERLENDADFGAIEASKKRQAGSPRTSLQQVKRELAAGCWTKKNAGRELRRCSPKRLLETRTRGNQTGER